MMTGDVGVVEESKEIGERRCIRRFRGLVDVVWRIHGTLVGEVPPDGMVPWMASGATTFYRCFWVFYCIERNVR